MENVNKNAAMAFALPVAQVDVPDSLPVAITVDDEESALPSFCIDWWAKDVKKIYAQWKRVRVTLTGENLDVYADGGVVGVYKTSLCTFTIDSKSKSTYILSRAGEILLKFYCPSPSVANRFTTCFTASQEKAYWAKPLTTTLESMIARATSIVDSSDASPYVDPTFIRVQEIDITVSDVQDYIRQMLVLYNTMAFSATDREDLYQLLLHIESEYVSHPSPDSFAHTVLQLNPGIVNIGITYQLFMQQCPLCGSHISLSSALEIHVGGKHYSCYNCNSVLHYETFKLAELLHQIPSTIEFQTGLFIKKKKQFCMPSIPRTGRAHAYFEGFWHHVYTSQRKDNYILPNKIRVSLQQQFRDVMNRGDLIQHMYKQLQFISMICTHKEYWMHPTVIQASIIRFNKFRAMVSKRQIRPTDTTQLVPSMDIELIAQVLQLKTKESVLPMNFGGDENLPIRLTDTVYIWYKMFHEQYTSCSLHKELWLSTVESSERKSRTNEWEVFGRPAAQDDRYIGVEETFPIGSIRHALELAESVGTERACLSVIGSFESDSNISGGRLRDILPQNASHVYNYRYKNPKINGDSIIPQPQMVTTYSVEGN